MKESEGLNQFNHNAKNLLHFFLCLRISQLVELVLIGYSWFHGNGSFSVHSFIVHYQSRGAKMLHTYIHTDIQTYRPSYEAGLSGAFAPKNQYMRNL